MNRNPRSRITRRAAEKALDGEPTTLPVVGELLAAARHVTPTSEIPGENHALTSFRMAQTPLPRRQGRLRAAKAATIAALSTKFAAGAIAAVAAGGVVLAASTGVLPGTHTDTGRHPSSGAPSVSASASPDLRGLCVAYRAEVSRTPGEAITTPAFTALAAAAGSEPVIDYCTRLLATSASTSHAITHPTGRPTTLPPQASSRASAHATSHPTGRPTSPPSPASPRSAGRPSGQPTPGVSRTVPLHVPRRP